MVLAVVVFQRFFGKVRLQRIQSIGQFGQFVFHNVTPVGLVCGLKPMAQSAIRYALNSTLSLPKRPIKVIFAEQSRYNAKLTAEEAHYG